jgi:hypothetical protein
MLWTINQKNLLSDYVMYGLPQSCLFGGGVYLVSFGAANWTQGLVHTKAHAVPLSYTLGPLCHNCSKPHPKIVGT